MSAYENPGVPSIRYREHMRAKYRSGIPVQVKRFRQKKLDETLFHFSLVLDKKQADTLRSNTAYKIGDLNITNVTVQGLSNAVMFKMTWAEEIAKYNRMLDRLKAKNGQ